MKITQILQTLFFVLVLALLLGGSTSIPPDQQELVRRITRPVEFDFATWTLDALWLKLSQAALGAPRYLPEEGQQRLVKTYLEKVDEVEKLRSVIENIYADPTLPKPEKYTQPLIKEQRLIQGELDQLGPLAESILQTQTSAVLAEAGIAPGGQPIPPLLYRVTPLPYALVVSPRDTIRRDVQISLLPELTMDEIIQLEKDVEATGNVSALVVPVGGIGAYPTMVMSTDNLVWLTDVIAHEWTHNYLTLHPLGIRYFTSGTIITLNETTATIVGGEIGRMVLEAYYPDDVPPKPLPTWPLPAPFEEIYPGLDPNARVAFNYNREMHRTRVEVDRLLAEGKVEEAEAYMEQRRLVFVNNGYSIRRINQAYFAFHGSYAESTGGGAQGRDPVGPAVYELREQSPSLAAFLKRIAWISNFEGLQRLLESAGT